MIDRATITKTLDRLEKGRLRERVNSEKDRRAKIISITPKGEEAAHFFRQSMHNWFNIVTNGFTDEEKKLFDSFCDRAAKNAWGYLHDNNNR